MKKLLLCSVLLLAMALPSLSQTPNCQINFGPWTDVNQSAPSFNGITQCAYWVITYQATGFSAISLHFQSATGTQAAPGTFADFTGTVATGINPNTSVACSTPTNCTSTFTGTPGWFKVTFPSHTGSGTIQGTLQGYKTGYSLGGNVPASGGCVGTVSTPCVVDGVTAAGAPPTTAPVLIAGQDGTNIQTVKTDTAGRPQVVGAVASGSAPVGNPVLIGGIDGFATAVHTVRTDITGNLQVGQGSAANLNAQVVGVAANATALAGNPVTVCGSDGTNCRLFLLDTSGRTLVVGAAADGAAIAGNPVIEGLDDGVNARYARSASLANMATAETLTGVNSIGSQFTEKGQRWSVISNPATSSKATASIAAEANVRHVVDCISFSASGAGAVAAGQFTISVRDGATGAGTVIWTFEAGQPGLTTGQETFNPFGLCGLSLVGTTNTAMTLEFNTGLTNLTEAVSMSGYNIN